MLVLKKYYFGSPHMLKENFKYVKLLSNQSYAKFSRVVLKSKILERAEHSGYRRGVYKID